MDLSQFGVRSHGIPSLLSASEAGEPAYVPAARRWAALRRLCRLCAHCCVTGGAFLASRVRSVTTSGLHSACIGGLFLKGSLVTSFFRPGRPRLMVERERRFKPRCPPSPGCPAADTLPNLPKTRVPTHEVEGRGSHLRAVVLSQVQALGTALLRELVSFLRRNVYFV